jgi:hypothetical protein
LCSRGAVRHRAPHDQRSAPEAIEQGSQPGEFALGAGQAVGQDAQISSLLPVSNTGDQVTDLTPDAQPLSLEGERVRVTVGECVLDLGDESVRRTLGLLVDEVADPVEDGSDVVRHRQPLSKPRPRDSMGRTAYLSVLQVLALLPR